MTYIPTKEELEELGFSNSWLYRELDLGGDFKIQAIEYVNVYLIYKPSGFGNCIYPQSIEDIKTLIRILTSQ